MTEITQKGEIGDIVNQTLVKAEKPAPAKRYYAGRTHETPVLTGAADKKEPDEPSAPVKTMYGLPGSNYR